MNALLSVLCGVALFASTVSAQALGVLDHFDAAPVDTDTWWVEGHAAGLSLGASKLSMQMPADRWAGLLSHDAIGGDFDVVLDFEQFAVTGSGRESSELMLSLLQATGTPQKMAVVDLGITGNSSGLRFEWDAEIAGASIGWGQVATTATAGELRVRRVAGTSGKQLELMVRPRGQKSWTTIQTLADVLGDEVYVQFWAYSDGNGTVSCAVESVAYGGSLVASPRPYGLGCGGFGLRHFGRASVGNQDFGTVVMDGPANAPTLVLLGFAKVDFDLAGIGAPGCRLYTTTDLLLLGAVLDGEGFGWNPFAVPPDARLLGIGMNFQSIAVLPGANALGLLLSNGVRAVVVR
jgi:hypothetical protein